MADRAVVALVEGEYRRYKSLGEGALDQLEPSELNAATGERNSVATLVWHIAGNLESRFTDFLTSDGEKPWRDRESEFEARDASPSEMREKWERGWDVLFGALSELADEDMTRIITIRGIEFRVDEALLRSLAHTSFHVGQIVYIGKEVRGDSWSYLTIPPGGSAEYNAKPTMDKASTYGRQTG